MKIIIDTPLVTLNKYINAERTNRYTASKIKKQQTKSVMYQALIQRVKPLEGLFDVHFEWHKPSNREDNDNIAFCKKFILDGLKEAKVILDDSPRYINNFTDTFILDKTKDYVWCIVTFVKVA